MGLCCTVLSGFGVIPSLIKVDVDKFDAIHISS